MILLMGLDYSDETVELVLAKAGLSPELSERPGDI